MNTEPEPRQFKISSVHVILLVAMLVGGVLRFARLEEIPPGFNQDEAVNGYDAYSLFQTGRDHLGHPFPFAGLESFGDWVSPLLTFITAPAVGVLGLHVGVVRGVTATLGVLAILVVYLLAYELFRRPAIGLAAAWAIALSPWAVDRSRFAIPPATVPLMVALTMLALVWTMQHQSNRGMVALGCIAALTVLAYPTMKLYIPILLLAGFLIYRQTLARFSKEALVYAAILFIGIAGPHLYLSLADPGGRARLDQVSVFAAGKASPLFLAQQYRFYFSPWVFFLAGNGHPGQSATPPGWGVEPLSSIPLLLAGTIALALSIARPCDPFERQGGLLIVAALLLYPIPGSLTVPTPPLVGPNLSRGIQLIPLLALVDGAGAIILIDRMKRIWRRDVPAPIRYLSALLLLGLFSAVALELGFRYKDYFTAYSSRSDVRSYFQYGLEDALAYVRVHQSVYDEVWISDADINEPYIYLLFYSEWPPRDVHENLRVRRAPPEFNDVQAIGKYHFGALPTLDAPNLTVVYRGPDSGGEASYEVHGGIVPGHGRVLYVSKP